jgi:nucleoside-diphosphate-sugar epimerase
MTKSSVLITGASGFLGKYIFDQYNNGDWHIYTIGRNLVSKSHAHIDCDLSDEVPNIPDVKFDKVIHVAGKAHVFPKKQKEKDAFFKVNVEGTQNLLRGLDKLTSKPNMIVFISSVAVYGKETGSMIKEDMPLTAESPYGLSKIQAERIITDWAIKNTVHYLHLRLPLIAGANPPGNFGTMKRAIYKGHYLKLKDNIPRKSIVVAPDVAKFVYAIQNGAGAYNLTDGIHPTFQDIELAVARRLERKIKITLPFWFVKFMAKVGDVLTALTGKEMKLTTNVLIKINSDLTFDDSKARKELNWTSSSAIEFVEKYL